RADVRVVRAFRQRQQRHHLGRTGRVPDRRAGRRVPEVRREAGLHRRPLAKRDDAQRRLDGFGHLVAKRPRMDRPQSAHFVLTLPHIDGDKDMQSWKQLFALAATTFIAGHACAAPGPAEAAELGATLTDIGAIKAANADGSIPAFDPAKAITKPVEPYKPVSPAGGFPYADPFAAEKPLFSITAANMEQHAAKLDDGTKYLLKKYPDYRIDVYPSHRTALLPAWVRERTVKNVARPKLVGDGDGIVDAHA